MSYDAARKTELTDLQAKEHMLNLWRAQNDKHYGYRNYHDACRQNVHRPDNQKSRRAEIAITPHTL
ncbi:MAG TPA: hypothetical protein VN457_06235, partial [Chlamydiales bacterium]|nr:hypothetical protein [Chlamydiales bacterium]